MDALAVHHSVSPATSSIWHSLPQQFWTKHLPGSIPCPCCSAPHWMRVEPTLQNMNFPTHLPPSSAHLHELTKASLGATESQPLFTRTAQISNISAFWVFSFLSRQEPLYCKLSKTAVLMGTHHVICLKTRLQGKNTKLICFQMPWRIILFIRIRFNLCLSCTDKIEHFLCVKEM